MSRGPMFKPVLAKVCPGSNPPRRSCCGCVQAGGAQVLHAESQAKQGVPWLRQGAARGVGEANSSQRGESLNDVDARVPVWNSGVLCVGSD